MRLLLVEISCILTLLLAGGSVAETLSHPAVPVVESLHTEMLETMQGADTLGYQGRFDKLQTALGNSFDLDFMARKAVGRSWKKFSEPEQERWLGTFERVTCANYAGRFTGYSGQSFETLSVEPASHETVLVHTRLIDPQGENVDLNYRLAETPNGWRIIDVYLDGTVSELALRRSEYSAVIKRDGLDELVSSIDRRVDELASVR